MRISGPYRHRAGWRFRVSEGPGVYAWAPSASTVDEARELADAYAQGLQARHALTIAGLVERYAQHLRDAGNKPLSVRTAEHQLARLAPIWHLQASALTQQRAKAYHQELARSFSAATQHATLRRVKALWAWAFEEGLVRTNVWQALRPIGRARRGKPQLTLDEARKLSRVAAQRKDDGGLAVLLALHLGLRNGEICALCVRDADLSGALLRVQDAKTQAGRRALDVPDFLRPALRSRCHRPGDAPLLLNAWGQRPTKNWLAHALTDLCAAAGVPRVVPHSLRGLYASLHYADGVDPNLTARKLGHRSPKVTQAHYATPEARHAGEQKRRERNRRR